MNVLMIIILDTDEDESSGDFSCTAELVNYITEMYRGYFTICIAGIKFIIICKDSVFMLYKIIFT